MKGAHTIENGNGYTVIATDDDGDGIYDDVHYVHTISSDTIGDYGHQPVYHEQEQSSDKVEGSYSGGGSLPWKKLGIAALVILAIYGIITLWDYIQFLFH